MKISMMRIPGKHYSQEVVKMPSTPKLTKSLGVFSSILSPQERHERIKAVYQASGGKPVVAPKPLFPDPQTHQSWYMPKVGSEMR